MSSHDERELRARLSVLLDDVEPSLPPVTQVVRRGRGIRLRRWISLAAGLAIIAGAALVPGLLQGHRVSPSAPLHYKVTVTALGKNARDGVVGAGTIDNKRWRVVVTRSMSGCAPETYLLACGLQSESGSAGGRRQATLDYAFSGRTQFELGTVGADVTRVVIWLSNGTELGIRPVKAGGQRWVAVAAPPQTITRAVSFVGKSEYQYALPYLAGGAANFVTWLRPGQAGLPVANASVGAGELNGVSWSAAVHTGPWGYCISFQNSIGSSCVAAASAKQLLSGGKLLSLVCGPLYTSNGKQTGAWFGVKVVPSDVKDVVLRFADDSRLRLATTAVAGTRVFGYAIPARPAAVRTLEYGVTGHLLHSIAGGWPC